MTKAQHVEELVRRMYDAKLDTRDEWTDWLYENHVFTVADKAKRLAHKYGIDEDLCSTAAMLHDIADAEMSRFHNDHETRSLEIARDIMKRAGYDDNVIEIAVEDAIRFHGCRNEERPKSDIGKVLATADGLAHLETDFYLYFAHVKGDQPLFDVKTLLRNKLERDYNNKLLFNEEKQRMLPAYETYKKMFR